MNSVSPERAKRELAKINLHTKFEVHSFVYSKN